jgi:hypothetical protein
MQVTMVRPGLWRWTGQHPAWTPAAAGWEQEVGCVYYEADDATVLVDPLVPPEDEERFWSALDRDVERRALPVIVALTAPWHIRSTDAIVARCGAVVSPPVSLPEDVLELPVPPVAEGQRALHLARERTLVTCEILTGIAGGLRVCPSPGVGDDDLRPFLTGLLDLDVDVVLPAHGAPVLEGAAGAVAAAIRHWEAPSAA